MIRVTNLSKKFGGLEVLKDVNGQVNRGDIISVVGPSGTGKSTFLRCLNLLERPTGGRIEINGKNILAKDTDVPRLRQKVGMVFQSFNLFSHLTVLENLTLGPVKLRGKSRGEASQKALDLLEMVGLQDKAGNYPWEISGGQQQRTAIARCLALDPEVILFDEPTSALDPATTVEVVGVMRRLAREGMTMIVVTHDMELARTISNRIFYMDEGIIYEEGTPDKIFTAPEKEKTRAFIHGIRIVKYEIKKAGFDLYGLNGEIKAYCEKIISPRMVHKTLLLTEELLMLLEPPLTLRLEYFEKRDMLRLSLGSPKELISPLSQESGADELSRAIIGSIASNITGTRTGEGYELVMELKGHN